MSEFTKICVGIPEKGLRPRQSSCKILHERPASGFRMANQSGVSRNCAGGAIYLSIVRDKAVAMKTGRRLFVHYNWAFSLRLSLKYLRRTKKSAHDPVS